MKKLLTIVLLLSLKNFSIAQSPVGKWKKISHASTYNGTTFDSHQALLVQRPCAAAVVYEVNADATYRLNAKATTCDERYKKIQEKLYSETRWQVKNGKITISTLKDFSVGQTYVISFKGNKMIWVGTEGQGTITYQKL